MKIYGAIKNNESIVNGRTYKQTVVLRNHETQEKATVKMELPCLLNPKERLQSTLAGENKGAFPLIIHNRGGKGRIKIPALVIQPILQRFATRFDDFTKQAEKVPFGRPTHKKDAKLFCGDQIQNMFHFMEMNKVEEINSDLVNIEEAFSMAKLFENQERLQAILPWLTLNERKTLSVGDETEASKLISKQFELDLEEFELDLQAAGITLSNDQPSGT